MIVNKEEVTTCKYTIELNEDEHSLLVSALSLAATYSNNDLCDAILIARCALIDCE